MAILKVYDNNGNQIDIPAIKGEPGITETVKYNDHMRDTTIRLNGGTQISIGKIRVMPLEPQVIIELNDGKYLLGCYMQLLDTFNLDNPLFAKSFSSPRTRTVQFVPAFPDIYTVLNTYADFSVFGFTDIYVVYISSDLNPPDGELYYNTTGRWD